MTKNLFEFATKELSQDAFLRWLFENWNCEEEDVKEASRSLITEILKKEVDFEKIAQFNTSAQERNIDLLIKFVIDEVFYLIVIEDKTYSFSHDDQLIKYKSYVDNNITRINAQYIYYKTNIISSDERNDVEQKGWEVFDINLIYGIFSKLSRVKNNILADYVEHIKKLYMDLTQQLPLLVKNWNPNHWTNFYHNNDLKIPEGIHFGYGNFRSQYIYLVFNKIDGWKKNPYGEVRSRDLVNDESKFSLRILLYDTDKESLDKYLDEWKKKFGSSELFTLQNYRQQLAVNSIAEKIKTKSDLERNLQRYLDEYARLMLN
jgi:hypothetical protein